MPNDNWLIVCIHARGRSPSDRSYIKALLHYSRSFRLPIADVIKHRMQASLSVSTFAQILHGKLAPCREGERHVVTREKTQAAVVAMWMWWWFHLLATPCDAKPHCMECREISRLSSCSQRRGKWKSPDGRRDSLCKALTSNEARCAASRQLPEYANR